MPRYYSKRAGPELRKVLEELAKDTTDERLDLSEEVDATRMLCDSAVRAYAATHTGPQAKKATADMRASAHSLLNNALEHVSHMVDKMAKVEMLKKDKISVHNIRWYTEQIMRAIVDVIEPKDSKLAKRFTEHILNIRTLDDAAHPRVVINID